MEVNLSKPGEFLFGRNAEHRLPANDDISDASRFDYLWIGCSDCPMSSAGEAVGIPASGFIFHDNIANLVAPADINCLAAMQFAVDILLVKSIVVCGHYECRSIKLATDGCQLEFLGNWFASISKTRRKYENLIGGIGNQQQRLNAICELNVVEQVMNACRTTIVKDAWERGQEISVYGLIYNYQNGLLADLNVCVRNYAELSSVYAAAISDFERRW